MAFKDTGTEQGGGGWGKELSCPVSKRTKELLAWGDCCVPCTQFASGLAAWMDGPGILEYLPHYSVLPSQHAKGLKQEEVERGAFHFQKLGFRTWEFVPSRVSLFHLPFSPPVPQGHSLSLC